MLSNNSQNSTIVKKTNKVNQINQAIYHSYYIYFLKNYNIIFINNLLFDYKTKFTLVYNELSIYNNTKEHLRKFYYFNNSKTKLIKILSLYSKYSELFPNYLPLSEKKYLYSNIKKKQKIIDKIENEKNKRIKRIPKINYNLDNSNSVFKSDIIHSINQRTFKNYNYIDNIDDNIEYIGIKNIINEINSCGNKKKNKTKYLAYKIPSTTINTISKDAKISINSKSNDKKLKVLKKIILNNSNIYIKNKQNIKKKIYDCITMTKKKNISYKQKIVNTTLNNKSYISYKLNDSKQIYSSSLKLKMITKETNKKKEKTIINHSKILNKKIVPLLISFPDSANKYKKLTITSKSKLFTRNNKLTKNNNNIRKILFKKQNNNNINISNFCKYNYLVKNRNNKSLNNLSSVIIQNSSKKQVLYNLSEADYSKNKNKININETNIINSSSNIKINKSNNNNNFNLSSNKNKNSLLTLNHIKSFQKKQIPKNGLNIFINQNNTKKIKNIYYLNIRNGDNFKINYKNFSSKNNQTLRNQNTKNNKLFTIINKKITYKISDNYMNKYLNFVKNKKIKIISKNNNKINNSSEKMIINKIYNN